MPGTRVKFVLHDRDAASPPRSTRSSRAAGARVVRSAVQAPQWRPLCRGWVRTIWAEVTDRMLMTGPRHLRAVLDEYAAHCNPHRARNLRAPDHDAVAVTAITERRDRAGGVIHEYRLVP
jgi:putative transposase